MTKLDRKTKAVISKKFRNSVAGSSQAYFSHWVPLGGMLSEYWLYEDETGPHLCFRRDAPLESHEKIEKHVSFDKSHMHQILRDVQKDLNVSSLSTQGIHKLRVRDPAVFCMYLIDRSEEYFLKVIGIQASDHFCQLKKTIFDRLQREMT